MTHPPVRTYIRFMDDTPTTRTRDDGYKGEYPKPLDWNKITHELGTTNSDSTDGETSADGSTLTT